MRIVHEGGCQLNQSILIVEDDATLRETVAYSLRPEGFRLQMASDGPTALALAREHQPDLIVLDILIPQMDGFGVLRALGPELTASVLVLTALGEEQDKVRAFELGASDHMTKPFGMRELVARVRALARRRRLALGGTSATQREVLVAGGVRLYLAERFAWRGASLLPLRPKEFDLLAFLMRVPGRVRSREEILERVWGHTFVGGSRTVDVHVRRLRAQIEDDPAAPRRLETVRGIGYRFGDDGTPSD